MQEQLAKTFPEHKFIGEESYAAGERPELTDEPTWIIDPIDGACDLRRATRIISIGGLVTSQVQLISCMYVHISGTVNLQLRYYNLCTNCKHTRASTSYASLSDSASTRSQRSALSTTPSWTSSTTLLLDRARS